MDPVIGGYFMDYAGPLIVYYMVIWAEIAIYIKAVATAHA